MQIIPSREKFFNAYLFNPFSLAFQKESISDPEQLAFSESMFCGTLCRFYLNTEHVVK